MILTSQRIAFLATITVCMIGCIGSKQEQTEKATGSRTANRSRLEIGPAEQKPVEATGLDATALLLDDDGESDVPEGHSHYGESFNEGPRQQAYLMGGTGNIDSPITTKNRQAQRFISQGIGQWHGFWFFEAERSFRQAADIDPDCAMAYWGMALANFNGESSKNQERAEGFIANAVQHRAQVTPRERMYID